jgi:hypothetical protein
LVLVGFAGSAASAAEDPQATPPKSIGQALEDKELIQQGGCKSDNPGEVIVCGRSQQRYRIDSNVLAATREAEALPPKPELDATTSTPCSGPNCGGGSYVPLVGMALTAIKAAELAAAGDDWRDAFRTHPDQYKIYQQSTQSKRGTIHFGVTAGNK